MSTDTTEKLAAGHKIITRIANGRTDRRTFGGEEHQIIESTHTHTNGPTNNRLCSAPPASKLIRDDDDNDEIREKNLFEVISRAASFEGSRKKREYETTRFSADKNGADCVIWSDFQKAKHKFFEQS